MSALKSDTYSIGTDVEGPMLSCIRYMCRQFVAALRSKKPIVSRPCKRPNANLSLEEDPMVCHAKKKTKRSLWSADLPASAEIQGLSVSFVRDRFVTRLIKSTALKLVTLQSQHYQIPPTNRPSISTT